MITIFRNWSDPKIKVNFDNKGVFITTELDRFKEEFLLRVNDALPNLGFNLSSTKIKEIVNKTVSEQWDKFIQDLKDQTK